MRSLKGFVWISVFVLFLVGAARSWASPFYVKFVDGTNDNKVSFSMKIMVFNSDQYEVGIASMNRLNKISILSFNSTVSKSVSSGIYDFYLYNETKNRWWWTGSGDAGGSITMDGNILTISWNNEPVVQIGYTFNGDFWERVAAPVPLPGAAWLLGFGLVAAGIARKRLFA